MSRKDYILIAEALQEARLVFRWADVDSIAQMFAMRLTRDNPRFNTEHFLAVVRGEKEITSRPTRR